MKLRQEVMFSAIAFPRRDVFLLHLDGTLQTQELVDIDPQFLQILVGTLRILLSFAAISIDPNQIEGDGIGVFRRLVLHLLVGHQFFGTAHALFAQFQVVALGEFHQTRKVLGINAALHVTDTASGVLEFGFDGSKGVLHLGSCGEDDFFGGNGRGRGDE